MKTMNSILSNRKFLFAVSLFTMLLVSSCSKYGRVAWVYYDETLCADKWERPLNNERLKDNIVAYFKSRGVRIYELEIYSDRTPDTCSECTCKTGRRVKAKVKGNDVDEMKSENFYQ
jgi:hypothetical protein